jgi:hypothetical protein
VPRAPGYLLPALLLFAVPVRAEDLERFFPPPEALAPLVAEGAAEHFTPDTLWEKINGEAELFRRFHLVRAAYRRYSLPDIPDETLEVGVYLLPSALDAFGLFAFFSPDAATSLPYGNGAVAEGHQGFLRHGAVFVTVDGFGEILRLVPEVLRVVAGMIGPAPPEVPVLQAVREIPGTGAIRYLPDHVMGRKVFPPGLEFSVSPGKTFFVATVPSAGEKIVEDYATTLDNPLTVRSGGATFLAGGDPSLGAVMIAVQGDRLAGVKSSVGSDKERDTLRRLLRIELP